MMPHSHEPIDNNSITLLIASIIIQAGIWITDHFANVTFTQLTEGTYTFLKICALLFSMWASWKVGKKHSASN